MVEASVVAVPSGEINGNGSWFCTTPHLRQRKPM